ncbi:MAG: ATP synthase F0 subunit C [Deltaproteobacteria bacterium]|nr:ATP synthase F0 subunit C [Deltaproteobacteria bacterium]
MKRIITFLSGLCSFLLVSAVTFAQEHGAEVASAAAGDSLWVKPMLALASGFAIGIAAFGGALGQSRAAAAALEGIARNPGAAAKVQTPMIIALALIESLVIYALVIAFLLQGKI